MEEYLIKTNNSFKYHFKRKLRIDLLRHVRGVESVGENYNNKNTDLDK